MILLNTKSIRKAMSSIWDSWTTTTLPLKSGQYWQYPNNWALLSLNKPYIRSFNLDLNLFKAYLRPINHHFPFFHFFWKIPSFWSFPQGSHSFYFFGKHKFRIFSIRPPSALLDSVLSRYRYLRMYYAGSLQNPVIRESAPGGPLILTFTQPPARFFPYVGKEF